MFGGGADWRLSGCPGGGAGGARGAGVSVDSGLDVGRSLLPGWLVLQVLLQVLGQEVQPPSTGANFFFFALLVCFKVFMWLPVLVTSYCPTIYVK